MNNSHKQNAIIIGGGPAGLGAALMLAKRGWKDITVIEKRPSADYYEPDKSFSYQIDGRGQKLTDFLGITNKLADLSVPNTEFYITVIQKDGTRKTTKLPIADANRKTAYWLPRADFVNLLYQEIQQNYQDKIQVLFNTECLEIQTNAQNLSVIIKTKNQHQETLNPNLIIGCDGLNSIVRKTLYEISGQSNLFEMQKFPSPSAGLKYKVLSLPPQFPLSETEDDLSKSTMAYAIRSNFKDPQKAISLGLLPFKNPQQPRTANIINYPDHQIWQLQTPAQVEDFFKQGFPQLPIDKIISSEEISRFTASEGGKFPIPQYCSGLYQIFGTSENNQGTAVILLGDAVHCFPPDIGQGVNSALEDIYIFQEKLQEHQDHLTVALPSYQNLRQPDIKALIRLVQISYPWQYNQNQLQKRLWSINFFLRFLLNRLFPSLFSPHSFLLIQNHELSYSEILVKSNRTTQNISILGGIIILGLILMFTNSN
ncbi:MAG: FAD-dependent monooxygenase [Nostocales cyanobacterium]|nr:MAG: FAD-dependent monooxygenase [Nostocales cyanobacterium]TAF19029.1 MAG: FAD-dependent monooxygenase [Nostocales cyanobacterium]